MSWLRFWKRSNDETETDSPAATPDPAEATAPGRPAPNGRSLPPHVREALTRRQAEQGPRPADAARKLAAMRRQRLAILYDIEQGELASADDNPWQRRIELLTEALATVEDDLARSRNAPPEPYHPVPPTPIEGIRVETGKAVTVEFTIGDEQFRYAEDLDWAERGHQIAQTELRRRSGSVERLLSKDTPPELREALLAHLEDSLFVFASDLRDRSLDGDSLPSNATLADIAKPCLECGGWMDWRGRCQACAVRAARQQELKREENRLLNERAAAAEERHRLAERLPIARRRLADLDLEIGKLEKSSARS